MVATVLHATATWEAATDVRFRYLPEADDHCLYSREALIKILPTPPSLPGVSVARALRSGPQIVFISRWHLGSSLHELGHVLGFSHEFRHPDAPDAAESCLSRDGYHLLPWLGHVGIGAYDAFSIMIYSECSAARHSSHRFSQYRLSPGDVQGAILVYGPSALPVLGESARIVSKPREFFAPPGRYLLKNINTRGRKTPPYVWEADKYAVISQGEYEMTIEVPNSTILTVSGFPDVNDDYNGIPRAANLVEITAR